MKKLMMSIFIVTALASCSSENEIIDNGGIKGDERVEIKLKAGVSSVETKAAIDNWEANTPLIFFHETDATAKTYESWDATVATDGTVTFDPKRYYDVNEATSTSLIGIYAPEATLDANKQTLTIGLDGDTDVMGTIKKTGSAGDPITGNITFEHLLTQLNFTITAGDESVQISKLIVTGSKNSATLDLSTITTTKPELTFAQTTENIDLMKNKPATAVKDFKPSVLVAPGSTLSLEVTIGGKDFTVSLPNTTLEATTAYAVELQVTQEEINISATPGNWTPGTKIEVPIPTPSN